MTQIASSIPVIDESQTRNIRLKHNEQPQYEQLNRMLANHEHISKDQHTVENYKTFKHDVTYKATHIVRDK
jgi:hypothetical protein